MRRIDPMQGRRIPLAVAAALAVLSLGLSGCDSVQALTAQQTIPTDVSWSQVSVVFQKSCLPCHGPGNTPAFDDSVQTGQMASRIHDAVSQGWMPPAGTVRFSFADQALLLRWADSAMAKYPQKKGG